jgi:glutamate formiminotransferase
MPKLVEAVPNISEGRRAEVVAEIAGAIRKVTGVTLLDVSSDASHHRTVLTMVGSPASLEGASFALFEAALSRIDLRQHRGEHPRLGAVDVLPFIPIEDVTMEECVALARRVAEQVARRFGLPVFLYEEAATRPDRGDLAAIRRGEFEGLAEKLRDPRWTPDYGPAEPHASAGATVVGARAPLIAFNVNLGTERLEIAKAIAKAVRASSGGLRFVKALGLEIEDKKIVQVSMNLTDYRRTPVFRAFEMVRMEAEHWGVPVMGSEIVGLVPAAALLACAEYSLRLENFRPEQVLEERIRRAREKDPGGSPGGESQDSGSGFSG